ncbi:Uncharacterized conserved protein, DUF2147 family [Myxococcus fulvus]|uniref:Uncharacterized conserved protein, DUF2147 family n=1 Tax=Myxococcus fulvus TaxID=33 RepID=A0A511TCF4_MYXFU|nr:DUF2147 domain-containing protein [Myxococcus fulvus]AKF80307.1 hypothetical protein MFUL124B02_10500 [Myxococcus fulvus 124B02]GEN11860.1 hypothetical protein MFU01_68970 [Myxococcus fulvus]SEU38657.1 Uncharacterized conserved protein, DUF2147 family [Myxococcus fulvus]
MKATRWFGLTSLCLMMASNALAQDAAPAAAPAAEAPAAAPAAKAPAAPATGPTGRWTTIDDETKKPKSVIVITEQDGKLFGKIEKLFREPTEDQNPVCDKCQGSLKDQPIIGMTILQNLKKDDDEWTGGTILDPANGKTYKCKVAVEDGGKKLKVRGYIGMSLLGRTQHWVRATE